MTADKKRIISLRFKLSFAFFISGMTLLLILRFLAPALIHWEFIKEARESHYSEYKELILLYIGETGTWGTEESARRFFGFLNSLGPDIPPPASLPLLEDSPEPHLRAGRPGDRIGPQFSIGMADMNGYTLIPFKGYEPGDSLSDEDLLKGDLIHIDGTPMAYAFPNGSPSITEENRFLLDKVNSVLNHGFIIALCLALTSGLILGTSLSRSLRKLTDAAESLKSGLEGQQITDIKTRDEIEILADVINEMSLELADSHNRIKELAIRDELTSLYNRRFFNHEMEVICANSRRHNHELTIVLGDVDFFKKVNDDYSHQIGDEVLRELARLITEGVREGDIVARYGGEELILALPETGLDDAHTTIERIRLSIESHDWDRIAPDLKITMSFGICCEKAPENYEKLAARADENLYTAKKNGRNRSISSLLS